MCHGCRSERTRATERSTIAQGISFKQDKISIRRCRTDAASRHLGDRMIIDLELVDQAVALANGVGDKHANVTTSKERAADDLGRSDDQHRYVGREHMGEFAGGCVALDRLDDVPGLSPCLRAGDHSSREPDEWARRWSSFDQLSAGHHELHWIAGCRAQRDSRFANKRNGADIAGTGHVAESLDGVHTTDRSKSTQGCLPDATRPASSAIT